MVAGRLRGVFCALITPMGPGGEIDIPGLERLTGHVVSGGAAGICPVGSTGEGSRLTARQRHDIVRRVRALVPPGMPVIPAPATAAPAAIGDDIRALADLGADAVLLAPPGAYALNDDDVRAYYLGAAETSALPVLIYHFPALTRVPVSPAVAGELAGHPRVAGLKDSGRDLEYTQAVLYATRGAGDFAVLTGSDTLLAATMLAGGAGAICGSANLVPRLGSDLYAAAAAGDWPRALALQERLFAVVAAARAAGFPRGWKAALQLAGICSGQPAPPALPVRGEALDALRVRLAGLGVL